MLRIRHETLYRYDEPVRQSVQSLRLTPRREHRQRTLAWQVSAPGRRSEQLDAHGNIAQLLTLDEPHQEIRIVVSGLVDIVDQGPLILERGSIAPLAYLMATPLTGADAALAALAGRSLQGAGATRSQLEALAAEVCTAVRYRPGTTTVTDTAISALQRGEGVCQDQAHVFLAACRTAGVPARYVSGYLLSGHDSDTASHAWVDVWLAQQGAWLGIDVTHQAVAGAQHCRLAVGRDYLDAAPVRGVRRGGGHETLQVRVLVASENSQQ
jgi:transglutaminase-like putative cysteine protease